MLKIDLLPGSDVNPRNSEGSMVELKDGSIMFVYTHFYGGKSDASSACLAGRYSSDRGRSWTGEDDIIIKDEGQNNVMSVSLLRLLNDEIILGYSIKNSGTDNKYYIRKSGDEGRTWGERICVTKETFEGSQYFVVNNDRIIQLSNGRLLVPSSLHPKKDYFAPGQSVIYFSDDNGETWTHSPDILYPPDAEDYHGLQEPGVVETGNSGKVLMWTRTNYGFQYYSVSEDYGTSWSRPFPSKLASPLSPASIKAVPGTGTLLAVFNDHSLLEKRDDTNPYMMRTPLVSRISLDEGKNWIKPFVIEDDPEGRFCYTSMLFVEDRVILSYSAPRAEEAWGLLRVAILEKDEFMGT